MTGKSKIEWTDVTWNPLAGCSIVSPGCANCYAMRQAARIERMGGADHYVGLTEMVKDKPVWTGKTALASEKTLRAPLRWKTPLRIFVNSMSDLFHENVPDEWIDKIFAVMALSPQHTFQVLTKRSKRMRAYMAAGRANVIGEEMMRTGRVYSGFRCVNWPFPNVWLGVTAEDQTRADERIPDLLATPAAARFVSVEPMLGPVDLRNIKSPTRAESYFDALDGELWGPNYGRNAEIDWIICGGESGPGARPMHWRWEESLRQQCAVASVPYFRKQWGEWKSVRHMSEAEIDALYHPAPEDNPEACRRCKVESTVMHSDGSRHDHFEPNAFLQGKDAMTMFRVGKLRAGRLLDGREHNDFPEPRP